MTTNDLAAPREPLSRPEGNEAWLARLAELVLLVHGNPAEMFNASARIIGEVFGLRGVCLCQIHDDCLNLLSVYLDDKVRTDLGGSPLTITPGAKGESIKDLRINDQLAGRFPEAEFLRQHDASCYGFPAHDSSGRQIGAIWLLDDKPHDFTEPQQHVLRLFAQRMAAELKRMKMPGKDEAERLRASEARLKALFEYSPISIWEEDFSQVKAWLDVAGASGVRDWRAYFDTNPEAVLTCASKVRILDINRTSVRMFGASNKEEIPVNLPSYFTPESLAVFREELIALASGRTTFESEIPIRTPQGALVFLYLTLQIVPGFEHSWGSVLVSFIDITARKQAEAELARINQELERRVQERSAELKRSELLHRTVLNLSSDWVFVLNIDDEGRPRLVSLSGDFAAVTGYSLQDLMELSDWRSLVHEDDREGVARFFTDILAGTRDKHECRLITKTGETRWLRFRAVAQRQAQGETMQVWGAINDFTQQMHYETRLHLTGMAFESIAEGILITDVENNIVSVNQGFTDITGYQQAEVVGQNPRLLKSGRHDREFYAELWHRVNIEGVWRGEIWDRRKNGEIFPVLQTISVIRNEHGHPTNYISIIADISNIKRSQERLDFLAYHDPLTELPNRVLLSDRIDHAIQHARREGHRVGLLFLDMDRFKNINDSLGHPVGDSLLQQIAERIRNLVRNDDTIARLGGDEFVILMEHIESEQDCAVLARKIIDAVQTPFLVQHHTLHLTVSIGISLFPNDGAESATLIRNADAAMYRAKEMGRNNYQFYTEALTNKAFERLLLEGALRRALERNELIVHYQPKVDLKSGRIAGAEALVRWQHPEMGMVPPDKFIPVAEESGLIDQIGEWVLHTACRQMVAWQKAGYSIGHLAVNVSGRQFQRSEIVAAVGRALAATGLDGRHLELEITESIIMQVGEEAATTLKALRDFGATIAIDDFGTGYSSLSYLKHLPVNKLKVDRSFVRDIPADANDVAITQAVIAMGHNLQLEVVAEGIESVVQLEFLTRLGCSEGQGYLFSRPLPADELGSLLQAGTISVRR